MSLLSPEWWSRHAGWLIAGLILAITGWTAFLLPDDRLAACFTDDSFFYLNVARHAAAGDGFTFDGFHPTTGFQPLWLLLLIPVFRCVHGVFLPLRCVIVLQSLLLAASGALTWRILRSRLPPAAAAATSLLLFGLPGARLLWIGMESALFLLALLAAWAAWLRVEAPPEGPSFPLLGRGAACPP